ncbi:MAG: ABC transporter transmembrane domain-containing protein, partial [Candidatus Adiutrix sp.]
MSGYFKLLRYVRPYVGRLMVGFLCLVGASASQLVLPWMIKDVIDEVLIAKDLEMLNFISIAILILFIIRGFLVFGQQYLMESVAQRVVFDLRKQIFTIMVGLR